MVPNSIKNVWNMLKLNTGNNPAGITKERLMDSQSLFFL